MGFQTHGGQSPVEKQPGHVWNVTLILLLQNRLYGHYRTLKNPEKHK